MPLFGGLGGGLRLSGGRMLKNEKESTVWSFSKRGVIFSDQNIFPANIYLYTLLLSWCYINIEIMDDRLPPV